MVLIAIIAGIVPGFAWLVFYLGEDPHPEPRRLIVFTFLVGMAYGFFTIAIEEFFNNFGANAGLQEFSIISLVCLALIEEIMKFAAAHFAINKSPAFDEPIDAMIYMIVAGLGFATLENIGAVVNLPAHATMLPAIFETVSFRFVGATLLHSLTSGIVGYYWALGIARKRIPHYVAIGIVIAAAIHAVFNYLVITYGNAIYTVVFLGVIGFFVLNDFEKLKTPKLV